MRRFSGAGGNLFSLGERFSFSDVHLEDCGDGWDWRAPIWFSYWVEEPSVAVVDSGDRTDMCPVETFLSTGRVGLPRNMSHGQVIASGVCLPISPVCILGEWEVNVDVVVGATTMLGHGTHSNQTRVLSSSVRLFGVEVPITQVLARLPHGAGMFVGVGNPRQVGDCVEIEFDQEGVCFDRC